MAVRWRQAQVGVAPSSSYIEFSVSTIRCYASLLVRKLTTAFMCQADNKLTGTVSK